MATGLTISTTSNLNSLQQTLMTAATLAFEPAAPDPSLVMQKALPTGHYQWIGAIYARLAQASQLTEGVDLSQVEQLATTTATVNPAEHGTLVTLSKRLVRRQNDSDPVQVAGDQMGGNIRRREANDIIALYGGFSKIIVGAGSALDITYFRGTVAYLITDNNTSYGPAPMPVHAALHSEHISDIILDITDPGTAAGNRPTGPFSEMLKGWWRGSDRLYGIPIFHSGNISRDTLDDADGTIKHMDSLIEVEEGEADPTVEVDNSHRITEYGLFKSWGEVERIDPWGVVVRADAAATV